MRLELCARGRADVEEAWDRYARTSRWGTWSPQVRSTTLPEHLVAGATGEVAGPLGIRAHAVVGDVDHGARRWSWTVRLSRPCRPRVALRLGHEVGDRAGTKGSRTSLVLTGRPAVVLAYALPARLALARLVRA